MSNLEGVVFYPQDSMEDIIISNLTEFLRQGLLEMGAYYNVGTGNLIPLVASGHNFQYYYGRKPQWIWEDFTPKSTGLVDPVSISGILVNGVFVSTGTAYNGTGYIIDYPRGRIVFDHPLPSGTSVAAPHSYPHVTIYPQDSEASRKIQDDYFTMQPSGNPTLSSKIYLPTILVGVEGQNTISGSQLGSRDKITDFTIQFDILANNNWDADKLKDILTNLENKSFYFYNSNIAPKNFNSDGSLKSTAAIWSELSNDYPYRGPVRFKEDARVSKFKRISTQLWHNRVRISLEIFVSPY